MRVRHPPIGVLSLRRSSLARAARAVCDPVAAGIIINSETYQEEMHKPHEILVPAAPPLSQSSTLRVPSALEKFSRQLVLADFK